MGVEHLARHPLRVVAAAVAALLGFLLLTPLSHSAATTTRTGAGGHTLAADQSRPAGMLPRGGPYPSGSVFVMHNAWAVGDRRLSVYVYAGSVRSHRRTGELLILRNHANGTQRIRTIRLPGSGRVSIDRRRLGHLDAEPARAAVRGRVPYTTARGERGYLNLATDRVTRRR